jgi:hypothetical protein
LTGKAKSTSARKKGSKKRLTELVDSAKSHKEEDQSTEASDQDGEHYEKKQEEVKKNKYPIAPDGL